MTTVSAGPVGTTHTFIAPLERAARIAGDATAVSCGGEELSYDRLIDRCRRLIGALQALGLRAGDRVGVQYTNCHRYLELYLAVPAAGLVLVPINSRHTARELRYTLDDSGARVLFADADTALSAGEVEHFVAMPDAYESLLAIADPGEWGDVSDGTLAGLFYTGGTTSAAKGVMLTHGNLVANAFHFMVSWQFRRDTRWLVVAPMFHAAGTIATLATVWTGGRHIILPRFDPGAALDAIEREAVTATVVVPTMLAALVQEQRRSPRDVSSLRCLMHGAAPISRELLRGAVEAFPDAEFMHIYGTTETAPIITVLSGEQRRFDSARIRSCGQAVPGVEIEVVDPHGRSPLAANEVGEVRTRGHNVMCGYWNKPAETAKALDGGWYSSGDLGYLDEDGYLYLVDRLKDMIVSGGENVYSAEVEDALSSHPSVREAAVFGVPDDRWGEAVHAVVVPDGEITEQQLQDHCRTLIADYKTPKRIEFRDDPLPKTGAGKILKRELREPYWRGRVERIG